MKEHQLYIILVQNKIKYDAYKTKTWDGQGPLEIKAKSEEIIYNSLDTNDDIIYEYIFRVFINS
jgi:hypothetical protein